jgi:hypothetical protein
MVEPGVVEALMDIAARDLETAIDRLERGEATRQDELFVARVARSVLSLAGQEGRRGAAVLLACPRVPLN